MRNSVGGDWHILDAGSIWIKEFASALNRYRPVEYWTPAIRSFGHFEDWERVSRIEDPPLQMRSFPLQRGYARFPLRHVLPFGERVAKRIAGEGRGTLVCTSPFYAPVAECWQGPVIYYLTDKTAAYEGMDSKFVTSLDRRMCRKAALVCPNSARTGRYLQQEAGCAAEKIVVVPNATRRSNVLDAPLWKPGPAPEDLRDLPRPWIGVIGNLAANVDWHLIRGAVDATPEVSWVFVGPAQMEMADPEQRAIRTEMLQRGGRVRFTGAKPYGELARYGQSFDAALMPYSVREPMLSASATRFYEHLAACRPILASPGVEELWHKEPLLKLVRTSNEAVAEIRRLSEVGFQDGYEEMRWRASQDGTWERRAETMMSAAAERIGAEMAGAVQ